MCPVQHGSGEIVAFPAPQSAEQTNHSEEWKAVES